MLRTASSLSPHASNLRLKLRLAVHARYITRVTTVQPEHDDGVEDYSLKQELEEAYKRKRKTEWKRRQRGQTFLDNLIVTVRGGKGGDGCVAFHREKFVPHGPPSGGNGGKGGDVYILPTPGLTTLSSIQKRIRGAAGGHGKGTWMNGRNAPPTVIRVPIGTVVRELTREDKDGRRAQDEWEAEEEGLEGLSAEERVGKMRDRRWVHYPGAAEDNLDREAFLEAERMLYREERQRRMLRREQQAEPIHLDLDAPIGNADASRSGHSASSRISEITHQHQAVEDLGYLVAAGGSGGHGNPAFVTTDNRSPKFATRGLEGQRVTLSLELKILADIGLVGYPNAGKSTLLRALTGGRAKTEVAGYAFTTLNPSVGVVRIDENGGIIGGGVDGSDNILVIDDTLLETARFNAQLERGELAEVHAMRDQNALDAAEVFRFTVADNPGLIADASADVGLGHSFLRSIERALALVYVVDLSSANPTDQLHVLQSELEAYKPGLSAKARMVIANKADVLGSEGEESVHAAREKLSELERFVRTHMRADGQDPLDVVPVSAKYSQNLQRIAVLMRSYVEKARDTAGSR